MEITTPAQDTQKPKNKFLRVKVTKKFPLYLLAAVILFVVIVGLPLGYSRLFVKAQNDIGKLKATVAWQKQQINWLEGYRTYAETRFGSIEAQLIDAQISGAGNYENNYKAPDVTIDSVTSYVPDSMNNTGQKLILVDFTAKNNSNNQTYLSASNYKLKDGDSYEYQIYNQYYNNQNPLILPGGRSQADAMSLMAGETSKGTMVYLLTRPATNFKIIDTFSGTVIKSFKL